MDWGRFIASLGVVCALVAPRTADAQPPPEDALGPTERAAEARPEDDELRLVLTAGSAFAYGNARSVSINLIGELRLRLDQHAFLTRINWLYGLASTQVDPEGGDYTYGPWQENASNLMGIVRYDYFLTEMDALFLAAVFRYDIFARLEPRVGGQAGYLRNLFKEENHRFWLEIGVDGTYDNFGEPFDIGGGVISEDRFIFSARGFVGYNNQLNPLLTYTTGLEILWELARAPGSAELAHLRFEWVNTLTSKIEDWLQIALSLTARLDSQPPGQVEPWNEGMNQPTQMLDLIGSLNLVGNFDFLAAPAAEEEEAACPECPTCPEPEPCPEVEGAAADEVEAPEAADAPIDEAPVDEAPVEEAPVDEDAAGGE